jgi:hypothetical protein
MRHRLPPLTVEQVLAWADAHHAHTGRWPTAKSGPVEGAPGETWLDVNGALIWGRRGLPRGSSLARLLTDIACARCGRPFRPERTTGRYCSTRCRVAAHRARKK